MEDVKIKTGFGGACVSTEPSVTPRHPDCTLINTVFTSTVTLVSLSIILLLTVWEFVDYRRVHWVRPPSPFPLVDTAASPGSSFQTSDHALTLRRSPLSWWIGHGAKSSS